MNNDLGKFKTLRILHLEDSPMDAEIIRERILDAGFGIELEWATNEQEFSSLLRQGVFDLILADYHLPQFDAPAALLLTQAICPGLPFICVSGAIGEENAVRLLKSGATDFVPKNRLDKLVLAIQRALNEVEERKERLLAEVKLRESDEQLRQSQKLEAVGQLAGGVAHDFNNILSVIMGYCELLSIRPLPAEDRESIEEISSAAKKAAQLTRALLAFSRKQKMDPKPVDLNEIIPQMQKFLTRIIGENIQLNASYKSASLWIFADVGQIEQVLMNLATNARDAMPDGGTLSIETAIQEVNENQMALYGLKKPGLYAFISVADTGMGMSPEARQRIFEPFFTTKESGKGTGLGMSIVHGIVSQHHGAIDVVSEQGRGTTFRILIPLIEENEKFNEKETSVSFLKGGCETILIAEDESAVRQLVETVLVRSGYAVIVAVDGQDAVDKYRDNSEKIKLVLMDVLMPVKSGVEALKEIRQINPHVKALFTSGYTAEFDRLMNGTGNKPELLMKPARPQELLQKIREILDK